MEVEFINSIQSLIDFEPLFTYVYRNVWSSWKSNKYMIRFEMYNTAVEYENENKQIKGRKFPE